MIFDNIKDHNSLVEFYRQNGLEVSDDIEAQDGAVVSLVYKKSGKMLCAATLSFRLGAYILDYIAVDIASRRNGLGAVILKEILKNAEKLGAEKVYLTARKPEFFKSQGFKEGSPDGIDMNADCIGCPQFQNSCTKLPMMIDLKILRGAL